MYGKSGHPWCLHPSLHGSKMRWHSRAHWVICTLVHMVCGIGNIILSSNTVLCGLIYLFTYIYIGVTHRPEIHHVDLGRLFEAVTHGAESKQPPETPLLCLILATDGVWDNWTYEDANRFVLDASCINAVKSDPGGARRVAASFMTRNAVYAKRNFGAQADNATGIVLYISQNNGIPNGPDFN